MIRQLHSKATHDWRAIALAGLLLVSAALPSLLIAPSASAATANIDPNLDGTVTNWTANPGTPYYANIDDGARQPTVPNTSDENNQKVNTSGQMFLQMSDLIGVQTVSQVVVWVYHNDGANGLLTGQLFDSNETTTFSSTANFTQIGTSGWNSITFSGLSLTQTQINNMRIALSTSKSGGGGPATLYVYSMYAVVTYTVPPVLTVDIVDGSGVPVGSPSASFAATNTSFSCGTATTGTLGSTSQRIRVTNTTTNGNWILSIAPTAGATTLWSDGTNNYDFNETSGSPVGCTDGGDADSRAGRLGFTPSSGTLTPQGGCATTGISRSGLTYFAQGTTDSVTLASASGSQTGCYYEFYSIPMSNIIPAEQKNSGSPYSLPMTVTIVAN